MKKSEDEGELTEATVKWFTVSGYLVALAGLVIIAMVAIFK
jgi:hypothetical protein